MRVVDATPRFLARHSPYGPVGDPAEAERLFLSAFQGLSELAARRLFYVPATPLGPPNYFGRLYLSCLIAAGTEDTGSDGDFRRRMCAMLGLREDNYVNSYDLPNLWKRCATWLEHRGREAGYRELALPDPDEIGRETIIGIPKALCFPTIPDRRVIARAMTKYRFSVESSHLDIVRGVSRVLPELTDRAKAAFGQFLDAYRHREDVEDTKFWAALESIDPDGFDGSRSVVGAEVWINAEGLTRLRRFDNEGRYDFDNQWLADLVGGRLEAEWRLLQRHFAQGCVALLPGLESQWVTARGVSRETHRGFLVRHDLMGQFKGFVAEIRAASRRVTLANENWWAIESRDVLLADLLEAASKHSLTGFGALDVRSSRVSNPVTLRDGIRVAGGWLVNSATAPLAVVNTPSVEVTLDGDHIGRLQSSDGLVHTFPSDLRGLLRDDRIVIGLRWGAGQAKRTKQLHLATLLPGETQEAIPDDIWVERPDGQIRLAGADESQVAGSLTARRRGIPSRDADRSDDGYASSRREIATRPLNDTIHALIGATISAPRSGLSFDRTLHFVESAFPNAKDPHEARRIRRLLVASGLLQEGRPGGGPSLRYWAREPFAAVQVEPTGATAFILGALGSGAIEQLAADLEAIGGSVVEGSRQGLFRSALRATAPSETELRAVLSDRGICLLEEPPRIPSPRHVLGSFPSRLVPVNGVVGEVSTESGDWREAVFPVSGSTSCRRHEVARWRISAQQSAHRFVFTRGDEVVWATQSRRWADWVWASMAPHEGLVLVGPSALVRRMPPQAICDAVLLAGGVVGWHPEREAWLLSLVAAQRRDMEEWAIGVTTAQPADSNLALWVRRLVAAKGGRRSALTRLHERFERG